MTSIKLLLISVISSLIFTSCGGGGGGGGGTPAAPTSPQSQGELKVTVLGSQNFSTPVGQSSSTLFKVENIGNGDLSLDYDLLAEDVDSDFALVETGETERRDCSLASGKLDPLEECYIKIQFLPSKKESETVTVNILNQESFTVVGTMNFDSSVTYQFQNVSPTGSDLNYGNVPAGSAKSSIINATNNGTDNSGILFDFESNPLFSVKVAEESESTCSLVKGKLAVITPAQNCKYQIDFSPVNIGDNGSLNISLNELNYFAFGTGVLGADIEPGTFTFDFGQGNRARDGKSISQTFSVTNKGPKVSVVEFTRPNALSKYLIRRSSEEMGCINDQIQSGESCLYEVVALMDEPGVYQEELILGNYTMNLSGSALSEGRFVLSEIVNGVEVPLINNVISFENKVINSGISSKQIVVTNIGEFNKRINPLNVIDTNQSDFFSVSKVSTTVIVGTPEFSGLAEGQSVTYQIDYNPTTKNGPVDQASFTFTPDNETTNENDGNQPLELVSTGNPQSPAQILARLQNTPGNTFDFGTVTIDRENPSNTNPLEAFFEVVNSGDVAGSFLLNFTDISGQMVVMDIPSSTAINCPEIINNLGSSVTIPANTLCTYKVGLSQFQRGNFSGQLSVDTGTVSQFDFSSRGVFDPFLLVDGSENPHKDVNKSLDLGQIIEGQSRTLPVIFSNGGDGSISISVQNLNSMSFNPTLCSFDGQTITLSGQGDTCTGEIVVSSAILGSNTGLFQYDLVSELSSSVEEDLYVQYTGLIPATLSFLKDVNGTVSPYSGDTIGVLTNSDTYDESFIVRNDGEVEATVSLSQNVSSNPQSLLSEPTSEFFIQAVEISQCQINGNDLVIASGGSCRVDLNLEINLLKIGSELVDIQIDARNNESNLYGSLSYSYQFNQEATFEVVSVSNTKNTTNFNGSYVGDQSTSINYLDADLYIKELPLEYEVTLTNTGFKTGAMLLVNTSGIEPTMNNCQNVAHLETCSVVFPTSFSLSGKSFQLEFESSIDLKESFYRTTFNLEASKILEANFTTNLDQVSINGFKEDQILSTSFDIVNGGNGDYVGVTCDLFDQGGSLVSLPGFSITCPSGAAINQGVSEAIVLEYTPQGIPLDFTGYIEINGLAVEAGESGTSESYPLLKQVAFSLSIEDAPVASVFPLTDVPSFLFFNENVVEPNKTFDVRYAVRDADNNPISGNYEIIHGTSSDISVLSDSGAVNAQGEFTVTYEYGVDTQLENKISLSINDIVYEKVIFAIGSSVAANNFSFEVPYSTNGVTDLGSDNYQASIVIPNRTNVELIQVNVGPITIQGTNLPVADGSRVRLELVSDNSNSITIKDVDAYTVEGRAKAILEVPAGTASASYRFRASYLDGVSPVSSTMELTINSATEVASSNNGPVSNDQPGFQGLWISQSQKLRESYPNHVDAINFSFDVSAIDPVLNPRCVGINATIELVELNNGTLVCKVSKMLEARVEAKVGVLTGSVANGNLSTQDLVTIESIGYRRFIEHGDRSQLSISRARRLWATPVDANNIFSKNEILETEYLQLKNLDFNNLYEQRLANAIGEVSITSAPSANCWTLIENGDFVAPPCIGIENDPTEGTISYRTRSALFSSSKYMGDTLGSLFLSTQADSASGKVLSGVLVANVEDKVIIPSYFNVSDRAALGANWLLSPLEDILSGQTSGIEDLAVLQVDDVDSSFGKSITCDSEKCVTTGGAAVQTINGSTVEFNSNSTHVATYNNTDNTSASFQGGFGVSFHGSFLAGIGVNERLYVVNPRINLGSQEFYTGIFRIEENNFVPICDDGTLGASNTCPDAALSSSSTNFAKDGYLLGSRTADEIALAGEVFKPNYSLFEFNSERYLQIYGPEYKTLKIETNATNNPIGLTLTNSFGAYTSLMANPQENGRILLDKRTGRVMVISGNTPTIESADPFADLASKAISFDKIRYFDMLEGEKPLLDMSVAIGEGVSVSPREIKLLIKAKGGTVNLGDNNSSLQAHIFIDNNGTITRQTYTVNSLADNATEAFEITLNPAEFAQIQLASDKDISIVFETNVSIDSESTQITSNQRYYDIQIDSLQIEGVW